MTPEQLTAIKSREYNGFGACRQDVRELLAYIDELRGMAIPDVELDAIRARANAATPGPWHVRDLYSIGIEGDPFSLASVSTCKTVPGNLPEQHQANASFIADARTDVPRLLTLVIFLNGVIRDLQEDKQAYRMGLEDGRKQERAKWQSLDDALEKQA